MLSLATLVSLTCATAAPTPPFLNVSNQQDTRVISIVDMPARGDGAVAELFELLPTGLSDMLSNCIEFQGARACMVRLEDSADLAFTSANMPELGAWEVAFRGPAAKEMNDLLEAHDKSEGMRGLYVISQAGHIACESEGPVCVIRSHGRPMVHRSAQE